MQNDITTYAGETKNISKIMCSKLKKFIVQYFKEMPEVYSDQGVKKFCQKACYDYSIKDIEELKESPIGKQVVEHFFGDLQWVQGMLEQKKNDIDVYIQFNHIWY